MSKAYGLFNKDSKLADLLCNYQEEGHSGFIEFSNTTTSLLSNQLTKYRFFEESVVLFAHYRYLVTY